MYLTLGSNVEPGTYLPLAVRELDALLGVEAVSHAYEAVPVGAPGTPVFLNAAVRIRTALAPGRLKREVIRPLEARLGRVRTGDPNAPRTIDIDIALVEDLVIVDPEAGLTLPDPEIPSRAHLALPLAELAPDLRPPGFGGSLRELAEHHRGADGVRRLEEPDLRRAARLAPLRERP